MPMRPRSGRSRVVRQRKSCCSSVGAGVFEAEHLAALRIDARHDMLDRAVLARRVHRLEDQQQRIAVGGVEKLLLLAQFRDMVAQKLLIIVLRLVDRLDDGRPFLEIDLFVRSRRENPSNRFSSRSLRPSAAARNHASATFMKLQLPRNLQGSAGRPASNRRQSTVLCRHARIVLRYD